MQSESGPIHRKRQTHSRSMCDFQPILQSKRYRDAQEHWELGISIEAKFRKRAVTPNYKSACVKYHHNFRVVSLNLLAHAIYLYVYRAFTPLLFNTIGFGSCSVHVLSRW